MRLILVFAILLVVGCSHTYTTTKSYENVTVQKLACEGKAYVALPEPGGLGSKTYRYSGQMTAEAIQTALNRYLGSVQIGGEPEEYDAALASARGFDARYLIVPEIKHWEDRATEWSGKRDRIVVKVSIVDVSNGNLIDSTVFKGKSRWFTLGGDHPQDLLKKPIEDYFASIF